jgi:hypothetical protein
MAEATSMDETNFASDRLRDLHMLHVGDMWKSS